MHTTERGHRAPKRGIPGFILRGAVLGAVCFALAACSKDGVLSFSNGQAAAVVIGEPDFTSSNATTTRTNISDPYGNPDVIDGRLYLPDYGNSRVLGYNSMPTSNGAPADFVLGASDFTTTGTLSLAESTVDYDGRLYMDEYGNNDVAVYDPTPTAASSAPKAASPQTPAFYITAGTVGGLYNPEGIATDGGKFVVTDSSHNRVLIWNSVPTSDTPPDLVLGQTDFTGASVNQGGTPSAKTMSYPAGVWTDGQRLVVLDTNNNRVLIWNQWPTTNDQPADRVLGQVDFTANTANQGGSVAANTLNTPYAGVWVNGPQLIVSDFANNRVLIWNQWPTTNDQAADVVLGQPNFTSSSNGTTASLMSNPSGLYVYGRQLIVAESGNNRYLVFNGTY